MNSNENRYCEKGTFTVWALGLCLILFLLGGISIDVWRAYEARSTLSEITDSAARAGASEIDIRERQLYGRVVINPENAEKAISNSVIENSDLQSVSFNSIRSEVNPSATEVTVEVRSSFSFFLLRMLPGASDAEVVARSSARPFEG
jgi:Flp pilus assembly protein TadG